MEKIEEVLKLKKMKKTEEMTVKEFSETEREYWKKQAELMGCTDPDADL